MVDSRSLNAVTSTSAFNFKSGDISGTAAKLTDEKMGQGSEYFLMGEDGQQIMPQEAPYIDRSAQLRATLNSLAMMNVANLLTNKKKQALLNETVNTEEQEITEETEEEDEMFRKPLSMNINTIHDRNKRMKKKLSKEDYEEYLRQMRERIKREHSSQLDNN